MVATVRVVAAGSTDAQDAAQVSEAAARQVKVDVAEAKVAEAQASHQAATHNPNGTTTWHVQAGGVSANGLVSLFEFPPHNRRQHGP